jgi:hypothetical protein
MHFGDHGQRCEHSSTDREVSLGASLDLLIRNGRAVGNLPYFRFYWLLAGLPFWAACSHHYVLVWWHSASLIGGGKTATPAPPSNSGADGKEKDERRQKKEHIGGGKSGRNSRWLLAPLVTCMVVPTQVDASFNGKSKRQFGFTAEPTACCAVRQ